MPQLPQPFDPLAWLPEPVEAAIPPVPTGVKSYDLITRLGPRIKSLTLWANQAGYQASVSIDAKNEWSIQQAPTAEAALVACLWGACWYRL